MPRARILVSVPIKESFRVSAMRGLFDVPLEKKLTHEWDVDLPIENFDWNVGLIVGSSGSGKTIISSHIFPKKTIHNGFKWDADKSILDHFPEQMEIKEITKLLSSVGFSSPPYWAKPFHVLSNGQKFRVELARILAEQSSMTVIDEFTSVIDRNSARVGAYALSKTAKRKNKKIVCISCHRDIIEWLEPEWTYDTDSNIFQRRSLRRPKIKIELRQVDKAAWKIFARHHYLTKEISSAAQCYVGYFERSPIVFVSYVHSVGYFKMKREHRTVVLPEFQGMGIGEKVSDVLWEFLKQNNLRVTSTLSHPALIHARLKTNKWRLKFIGHQIGTHQRINKTQLVASKSKLKILTSANRITARMEYVGNSNGEKKD